MVRILLAEDETDLREMVSSILEAEGYQVEQVSNGLEALGLINSNPPDCIILDIMLPGLDGHSLLMKISVEDKTKRIPVLLLTALGTTKDMFIKFQQVKDFIPKPFHPKELLKRIKKITSDIEQ